MLLHTGVAQTYDDWTIYLSASSVNLLYETWQKGVIRERRTYQRHLRDRKFIEFVSQVLLAAQKDQFLKAGKKFTADKASKRGEPLSEHKSETIRLLRMLKKDIVDHDRINAWLKIVKPRATQVKLDKDKPVKRKKDEQKEQRMREYQDLQEQFKQGRLAGDED